MSEVAIVGAGLAGIVCARALLDTGRRVVLFDKGRKAGGRLSSRRAAQTSFDHAAPLFTAGSDAFRSVVRRWAEAGFVQPWQGRFVSISAQGARGSWSVEPWVGAPTMSALPKALAEGLDVRASTRVGSIERDGELWRLTDVEGGELGRYGTVVVNTPAGQAVPLLAPSLQDAARGAEASMSPCWTVMFVPKAPWDPGYDAARFEDGPIDRAFSQASKPGRDAAGGWVLHAGGAWTREHWDDDPQAVIEALLEAAGVSLADVAFVQTQRWRYARASAGLAGDCLWDRALRMGACGDWCGGPGLEGAWRSGRAMAERVHVGA